MQRLKLLTLTLLISGIVKSQDLNLDRQFSNNFTDFATDYVVADFNNDGNENDYVIGVQNKNYLILNTENDFTSSNLFDPPVYLELPAEAIPSERKLDVGDLNNDGFADLIFTQFGDQAGMGYMLNDGNGGFVDYVLIGELSFVLDVKIGNFNGDEFEDLAILSSGEIQILHGTEDLSFSKGFTFSIDDEQQGAFMRVANLDGDDIDEIVLAYSTSHGADILDIGESSISAKTLYDSESIVEGMSIADVDLDGSLDVVLTANGSEAMLAIYYLNSSLEVTESKYDLTVNPNGINIMVKDLDEDGDIDIVTVNESLSNLFTILINDGSRNFSFQLAEGLYVGDISTSLGAINVPVESNSTDNPYLVTAINSENFVVNFSFFRSDYQSFAPREEHLIPSIEIAIPVVLEENESAVLLGGSESTDYLSFFKDFNYRTFVASQVIDLGHGFTNAEYADLNNDGFNDLIVGDFETSILLSDENGNYSVSQQLNEYATEQRIAIGDVDGDGDNDLFLSNSIYLNNGNGAFTSNQFLSSNLKSALFINIDGDNDLDLIAYDIDSDALTIYSNNGSGSLSISSSLSITVSQLAAVDYDNDGEVDFVAANQIDDDLYLIDNNDGTLTLAQTLDLSLEVSRFAFADITGDETEEVVISVAESQLNYVTLSSEGLSVTVETFPSLIGSGNTIYAEDIIGSGEDGLVVSNENEVEVYSKKLLADLSFGQLEFEYFANQIPFNVTTVPANLQVDVTYDGATSPPRDAGWYLIEAVIQDVDYKGSLADTVIITPDTITATIENVTKIYGDANPDFSMMYDSFQGDDTESSLNQGPMYQTDADETSDVGTYQITSDTIIDNNYVVSVTPGELTIEKSELVVTADNQVINIGDDLPEFTVTYEGFKNDDSEEDLDSTPIASVSITNSDEQGEYVIEVIAEDDNNYFYSFINGLLTIEKPLSATTIEMVEVFPNPVVDEVIVKNGEGRIDQLLLMNLDGQILKISRGNKMSLTDLKSGVFILKAILTDGSNLTTRLIKN